MFFSFGESSTQTVVLILPLFGHSPERAAAEKHSAPRPGTLLQHFRIGRCPQASPAPGCHCQWQCQNATQPQGKQLSDEAQWQPGVAAASRVARRRCRAFVLERGHEAQSSESESPRFIGVDGWGSPFNVLAAESRHAPASAVTFGA